MPRSLRYLLVLFGAGACHSQQARLLLPAGSGAVTLAVDSVLRPELANFPLRLTLTNRTPHPVVLVLDSTAHPDHKANTLYVTAGPDTFFLGVKDRKKHLVFRANTATSFRGYASFLYGKGSFGSFQQIDSVFRYGTLVYDFAPPLARGIDFAQTAPAADTLLLPTKLEARTGTAVVVDQFLPGSFRWQEKRLATP